MPHFLPFRALRYAVGSGVDPQSLERLVAPPYDVLTDDDVDAMQARSEHNVVHVDVPRGGEDRYERAAATLHAWRDAGVLVVDEEPSFTIYRMRFVDAAGVERDVAGVLGGLEVVDDGAGGVLPHERTTPKASTDRLDLMRATRTSSSAVWGLSLAAGLTALLAEPAELVGLVVDQGVEHRVERVSDPVRIDAIAALVASDDVLIADGHHRYAVSQTYRDEARAATHQPATHRAATHPTDSAAEQTLAFVNELVADQLSVAAIHRLYTDITLAELTAALEPRFVLTPTSRPVASTLAAMVSDGVMVLVGADTAWTLTARAGAFDDVRALDGAWLEATLIETSAQVAYQHGVAEVLDAIGSHRAEAAVLIRPVSVAEIERTAREGLLMPPKSTFFTPKLKTGFVMRPLDAPR